jgi:hypothetical protein
MSNLPADEIVICGAGQFEKGRGSPKEPLQKPGTVIVKCLAGWIAALGWGMKQLTLAAVGFERYVKTTPRAAFLAEMERVVPWSRRLHATRHRIHARAPLSHDVPRR